MGWMRIQTWLFISARPFRHVSPHCEIVCRVWSCKVSDVWWGWSLLQYTVQWIVVSDTQVVVHAVLVPCPGQPAILCVAYEAGGCVCGAGYGGSSHAVWSSHTELQWGAGCGVLQHLGCPHTCMRITSIREVQQEMYMSRTSDAVAMVDEHNPIEPR